MNESSVKNEKKRTGLFIFHRDLRIQDNIGFSKACSLCDKLYVAFIFNPEQISNKNKYRSKRAIHFMLESLEDLSKQIHETGGELILLYGNYDNMVLYLIQKLDIDVIIENRDYTPFALKREHSTMELCKRYNISYIPSSCDYYLLEPGTVLTNHNKGNAYMKFTPFYLAVRDKIPLSGTVRPPNKIHWGNVGNLEHRTSLGKISKRFVGEIETVDIIHGGTTEGLKRLHRAATRQKKYDQRRDILTYETTRLSAYLKFGCISVRRVYHVLSKIYGKKSGIVRELLWREFFAHVLFSYPEVIQHSYQEKYRHIKWNHNPTHFERWKNGTTGFPVVDAGMREMNSTGFMHNRVRMIVASFLCKVLFLNWRKGEQYFAQSLIDYDVASNNGNWQSISSTGVDGTPYYNTFNPFIQSKKYDPETEYIKRWIPELANVLPNDIHNWENMYDKYKHISKYPKPMVDYYHQKTLLASIYHS